MQNYSSSFIFHWLITLCNDASFKYYLKSKIFSDKPLPVPMRIVIKLDLSVRSLHATNWMNDYQFLQSTKYKRLETR